MKSKLLFILMFLFSVVVSKAQVIFDPANFDAGSLPEGMSIVTIDDKEYLQVILDGWNSILDIPEVTLGTNQKASCEIRFSLGAATDDTLNLNQVNGVVQLMDTLNQVDDPWAADPEATMPAKTAISQSPVTGEFAQASANVDANMEFVHQIQFFGQQTITWGATTGDTIWVGKIRAVTKDPNVLFVPGEADTTELSDGMSIVDIGGEKYLQIILNGWNSVLNIPEFELTPKMTANGTFKFVMGEATADTLTLAQINAAIQLMDTVNKVDNPWNDDPAVLQPAASSISQSPATGNFESKFVVMSADMLLVHQIQFFGQQTVNWGATTGDTMWVGTIYFTDKSKPADPADLAAEVDGSTVTLSWTASTDNIGVTGYIVSQDDVVLDTITAVTYEVADLADGTYTFSVVAIDAAENASAAATVDAQVGESALDDQAVETLAVYPNPVAATLNIKGVNDITEVSIINVNGAVVMKVTDSRNILNVAELKAGLYVIKVQTSSNVYSTTFLKK